MFPHPPFDFTHFFFSNLGFKTATVRNENKERGEGGYGQCIAEGIRNAVRSLGGV